MKFLSTALAVFVTISSFSQNFHLQEDFNTSALPIGWTNSAIVGANNWSFGMDASASTNGNNNIDGTPLVFFDDDILGPLADNTVHLITASFNNSSSAATYLEFDYNFREFAGVADSFMVDVYDGSQWQRVFSRWSNDCGNWISTACLGNYPHASIDISTYANSNCAVRFIYYDGNDWGWGIGLDNVQIWSPFQNDIQVASIDPIPSSCVNIDSLTVSIANIGSQATANFNISYLLNNGSPVSAIFNGSIAPNTISSFTFPTPITYAVGSNSLKVYTNLVGDQNTTNDTAQTSVNVLNKFNLPYLEGFESANHNWTVGGTNASWQVGVPNGTMINTAASGTQVAATNLLGNYNNNEASNFTSPCIFLGPSSNDIRITFDQVYLTETGFDYYWLEYSTDGGLNWQKVLQNGTYPSINWYQNSSGQYWEGSSSTWIKSSTVLQNLPANTTIRFRLAFLSDNSSTREGVAIDNFTVESLSATDLALNSIAYPSDSAFCGFGTEFIFVDLENWGASVISNGLLFYQVNNGTIVIDTLQTSINPGAILPFQFSQPFNFTGLQNPTLKVWLQISGDTIYSNDTLTTVLNNNTAFTAYTIPYSQDFDQMTSLGNFTQGWNRNPSGSNIQFTWILSNTSTPSLNTGPDTDATGGNFVFLETSILSSNNPTLTSPCISLVNTSNPILSFQYHKYGATMGDLFVQVYNGQNWIAIDTIVGQTHVSSLDPWKLRIVNLQAFINKSIKLRFIGTRGASFTGDMAIDDIRVVEMNNFLAVINDLTLDSLRCGIGQPAKASVSFTSYSDSLISKDSVELQFYINGQLVANENLVSDIPPFNQSSGSNTHDFNYKPRFTGAGKKDIMVVLKVKNNSILSTDTITDAVELNYSILPYFQGFEDLYVECFDHFNQPFAPDFNEKWGWSMVPDNFNSWHVTDTVQCVYGNNWGATTGNTGPYGPKEGTAFAYWSKNHTSPSYLYSPCFDLSNYNQLELEYWFHQYANNPLLMGNINLEADSQGIWVLIDKIDTVFATKNAAWERRVIDLTRFAGGDLQFRFFVDSATDNRNSSIDGFHLYDPLATDLRSNLNETSKLTLYPNPTNGSFRIELTEELIGEQYEILDLNGKSIKRTNFKSNREEIDLNANKGVYILRVPSKGITEKIVVY